MRKLVIIDGKSVFYRGYYAMGNLSRADGTPTGGVYGFAVIAMELISRLQPDKVVVAWDKAKTSISKRKMIYNEYKAGRTRPPEDFFAQIPLLRELVAALGWEFLERDDYEADDIIGTLARQADETGEYETVIVSSDLDMLQIVDKNVKMYRLLKGFSKLEEIDVVAVEEKYGIKKAQFLDLKALKGDASDNIPGVPGIGEKTAVKLLNEYGSVEGIYENIDKISGAVHDKLVAGKESAEMSYKLGKIMFDAPVSLGDVPELKVNGAKIRKALEALEFNSLISKYQNILDSGNEKIEKSSKKLPENMIVEKDVKKEMHEKREVAEKVLSGAKFWDLDQGAFLLNPLRPATGDKARQGTLAFDDAEEEERKKEEFWRQQEEFKKYPELFKIFTDYDLPLIPVLYKMEEKGVMISKEHFRELSKEYQAQVAEIEQKIYSLSGVEFNVNSPVQLSEVLFSRLQLPTKGIKKTTRGYSTGAKELDKLKNEHLVVSAILEYREIAKLLSTYVAPFLELTDKDNRIHTTFTQNVTSTGRLSSVAPNLQNIPVRTEEGKRIRTGFVAGEGRKFVSADYSQFELRLAAVLSGDTALVSDFNSGVDIHTKTAADVFNVSMDQVSKAQRRAAKTINFGVLYGMSAKGLADATEMSVPEARRFIDGYFEVRRPVREYLDKILKQAREEGFVETYYGRRRPTPDVKSPNFMVRSGAERAAQNMPIQGTEADLMKKAMIRVSEALPEGADLILQIHDSLIVECDDAQVPEVSEILKKTMEGIAPELEILLSVEVTSGENWGEL